MQSATLTQDPGSRTYYQYAKFLTENSFRLDLALDIFEHRMGVLLDPELAKWRGAAKMLLRRRDAIIDEDYVLQHQPQDPFAKLVKASCLMNHLLRLDLCQELVSTVVRDDATNQHALLLQAILVSILTQDHEAVVAAFRRVIEVNSDNEFAWAGLAVENFFHGDREECKINALRALAINPTNFCAAAVLRRSGALGNGPRKNPWDLRKRDTDVTMRSLLSEPLWCSKRLK